MLSISSKTASCARGWPAIRRTRLVQLKVGKIGMFEFHRADELIALGREAIRKAAAEIKEHAEPTPIDAAGA